MFDIGFLELMVIGIVALIVIGPERLPGLARKAGYWVGRARRFINNVRNDIDREIRQDELREALKRDASLDEIKQIVHGLFQTCLMLGLDNLSNFFQAYDEFLSKIQLGQGKRRVPYALDKALDMGYKKFKEIEISLENGKPKEKISKLQSIETHVEIESFYSYNG